MSVTDITNTIKMLEELSPYVENECTEKFDEEGWNKLIVPHIEELKEEIKISEQNEILKGNDKRKASCKKVGGEKKKNGHQFEKDFTKQYNLKELNAPIEYGAKSDTTIDQNHPICKILKDTLGVNDFNVSNKSGENIQFTLGQIPEFENIEVSDLTESNVRNIFNKYLKKSNSDKPADILVYKDLTKNRWIFFNMDDIVDYIVDKCTWRKLETGRFKGDFYDKSNKGHSQYITYEYRNTHKSYFLGLNGGKGKKFIELLMDKDLGIKHYCDTFCY
jgi:hypothetical protein